jgi:hypothetical protein
MTIYRRGVARANDKDYAGALADYSASIASTSLPAGVKAMAYYNRSLIHSSMAKAAEAMIDLKTALAMPAASGEVKAAARRKLIRMERAAG